MSDAPNIPSALTPSQETQSSMAPASTSIAAAPVSLPPELEGLPGNVKAEIYSLIASFSLRSLSGPDPRTAKIAAQSEMHEETCRLDGYKESLKARDKQGERDHEFRKKRLNHETARNLVLYITCIVGIGIGLYLYIVKGEKTVGSNIVTACFVALLGGKALLPKDKD